MTLVSERSCFLAGTVICAIWSRRSRPCYVFIDFVCSFHRLCLCYHIMTLQSIPAHTHSTTRFHRLVRYYSVIISDNFQRLPSSYNWNRKCPTNLHSCRLHTRVSNNSIHYVAFYNFFFQFSLGICTFPSCKRCKIYFTPKATNIFLVTSIYMKSH